MIEYGETQAAYSRVAMRNQTMTKSLVAAVLCSSVGISIVAVLALPPLSLGTHLALGLSVGLLAIGLACQVALQVGRIEERWYQGRAVAETAKSLTWQYMMGVPFGRSPTRETSEGGTRTNVVAEAARTPEEDLVETLKDLRAEFKNSLRGLGTATTIDGEISDSTRQVRAAGFAERKSAYLRYRLDDQLQWYTSRARSDRRLSRLFASTSIAIEVSGIGIAVYSALFLVAQAEATLALIATVVASLVGWSQSRRYTELVDPYSYTAEVLREFERKFPKVADDTEFRDFVEESEHAISREHQMWQIRRGVTPRKHLSRPG